MNIKQARLRSVLFFLIYLFNPHFIKGKCFVGNAKERFAKKVVLMVVTLR